MRGLFVWTVSSFLWTACGADTRAMEVSDAGEHAGHTGAERDAGGAEPCSEGAVTVELLDYELMPAELTVPSGAVELCAHNAGKALHDLVLRDTAGEVLARTAQLEPGESGPLAVELSAATYVLFCSLPGHESLGMKAALTVE